MSALCPVEISPHSWSQSWCRWQTEGLRDEPLASCSQALPCTNAGEFSTQCFGARLLGRRPGLSLASKHHGASHSEHEAGEVAVPPLQALAGDTLCSQECTDGCSVAFGRASCEWELSHRKTQRVPLSVMLVQTVGRMVGSSWVCPQLSLLEKPAALLREGSY